MVDSSNTDTGKSFNAKSSISVTTIDNIEAGTYKIGSAGSGIYIYGIIIEYFD